MQHNFNSTESSSEVLLVTGSAHQQLLLTYYVCSHIQLLLANDWTANKTDECTQTLCWTQERLWNNISGWASLLAHFLLTARQDVSNNWLSPKHVTRCWK